MAQESPQVSEVFTYVDYGVLGIAGYKSSGKATARGSVIEINHDFTYYMINRRPKIEATTLEHGLSITVKYIIDTANKKVAIELPLCMLDISAYRDELKEIHKEFLEVLVKVCKCLAGKSDDVKDDGNVRHCYEKSLKAPIMLSDFSKLIKPAEVHINNREATKNLCYLLAGCYPPSLYPLSE
mgnify:CR=1 FL=1